MGIALALTVVVAAVIAVPLALANTATPTSTQSTWAYVSGNSGPINVVVTGDWTWPTQSCASGNTVSTTNTKGHYAIGFAGSWNDSTTPNTLTGTDTTNNSVTLHVGNTMDQTIVDFCANATAQNPLPTGSFRIEHQYASLADFQADIPNGSLCINGYDIHTADQTNKDWNPGTNGDNTLKAGQYVTTAMCSTPQQQQTNPDMTIIKYERIGSNGNYVRGPIKGKVGQTIDYEIVVTNTGDVSLDVTLTDPRCDAGTITPSGVVTLAPTASQTYLCTHKITKSDKSKYINTATATASGITVSSSVVAKITRAGLKGVHHRAHPPKPVVKPANFTG